MMTADFSRIHKLAVVSLRLILVSNPRHENDGEVDMSPYVEAYIRQSASLKNSQAFTKVCAWLGSLTPKFPLTSTTASLESLVASCRRL